MRAYADAAATLALASRATLTKFCKAALVSGHWRVFKPVVSHVSQKGQTAIRIKPDAIGGKVFPHGRQTTSHFVDAGNTRRMDIIKTRSEASTKRFTLKHVKKFEIRLGILNGNDISVKSFNSPENIVEVRLVISVV